MKVALITGSCGLVGSEASIFFNKKGFKIIGIDNNYRKFFFGKDGDINWVKKKLKRNLKNYIHSGIDIRNYRNLEKIFKKYKKKIKVIVHAAAQPSHDWAKNQPFIDFDINDTVSYPANIWYNRRDPSYKILDSIIILYF